MKKTVSFIALLMLSSPSATAVTLTPSNYYDDINSGHKYFEAVEYITGKGIVQGYGDGSYKPDNFLNRAELLKILMEANYDDADFEGYAQISCFNDVPAGEWFTKYICAGKAAGIVNGYEDGSFRPANNINLVETLKIALKTFGYQYGPSSPWYKSIVDTASGNMLIPLDFTDFGDLVNRGQMADMITRILLAREGDLELDEYLGEDGAYNVTYASLAANQYVKGQTGGGSGNGDGNGTGDNENPSDVEGLTATAQDDGSVKLKWDAANDNVGIDGYIIHYGKTSVTRVGETYESTKDVGKVVEYNMTGLTPGTKYYFSVIAYDKAGNESQYWATEDSDTVKTPVISGGLSKVMNVEADAGDGEIVLSWKAVSDASVKGYRIYFDTQSRTKTDKDKMFWRKAGDVTQYTFDDLIQKQNYYFYVVAYDENDKESSEWSEEVSGTFEIELVSSMAAEVCTNKAPSSIGVYECTDQKKTTYNCETVQALKYYNYTFLRCSMTGVSADNVLVATGGILANGYNLISEKSGNIEVMTNASKVLSFWGDIASKESARGFAMAVTGNSEIEYGTDLNDVYGEDFIAETDVDVTYTVVTKAGSDYTVPLYYKPVFGCSPFSVYEKVYGVSNNGLSLKSETQIGQVKDDMCVD